MDGNGEDPGPLSEDPVFEEVGDVAHEDAGSLVYHARAAGHDVTAGHDELHHYWTKGPGLAKWAESPKPWTTLRDHLLKYLPPEEAKRAAAKWVHEVLGYWPGSDLNRVTHGKPPRGKVVGPG